MKNKKAIHSILLLVSLLLGALVLFYYWKAEVLVDIKFVPINIMILVLVYIATQFLKRVLTKIQNWWDWLYYISLVTIALPVFIGSEQNVNWLLPMTQFGVLFLIVPVLIEGANTVKQQKG